MFNFSKKTKEEPKDLKEALKSLKGLEESFARVSKELKELKEDQKFSVKKVGLVRFNPFKEVGGVQSFTLSLLNESNSGVVITSYYTREGNRVYGKEIKEGKSEYPLSNEEKKAIDKAKNINGEKK